MDAPAAIRATYSDWRPVKSRKVLQLVMEVPIEQTEQVMQALGAPLPDREMWVAIARLQDVPTETKAPADPMVRDAGMLAKEPKFRKFVAEAVGNGQMCSDEDAAQFIREFCGIESRAELAHNAEARAKFLDIKKNYHAWDYL